MNNDNSINSFRQLPSFSTPKPCKKDDMANNFDDMFFGTIYLNNQFKIPHQDFLKEYIHYEEFNEMKSYSKRPYLFYHNGTIKYYSNFLLIINDEFNKKYYVVTKLIPSKNDAYEKYCTCIKCSNKIIDILNPIRYIKCSICAKCIKAGEEVADPKYIENAKMLLNNNKKIIPVNKYILFIKKYWTIILLIFLMSIYNLFF